ncbi:MAG: nucleotidyl transferase AbiEii/AbiGii toxin family protein [Patescibacteria group bacterium]
MAQKTILTPIQRKFLELFQAESYLTKRYYWTGGTVLSEVYLHHRDSEDIDLFTEKEEVHLPSIKDFVGISGAKLGARGISYTRFLGLHTFIINFSDASQLKIDFNYYPFPRINTNKKWNNIDIDSVEDIATNKVHIISVKPRSRDFIDLYFLLKDKKWGLSLPRLISLAKAKFDWDINPIQLGENLAKVITVKDLPRMLVPFDQKEMEDFILKLAKSLDNDIFKN